MQEEKQIKCYDEYLLYAKEFVSNNPKGLILITTDVKEHSSLYDGFANTMCEKGFNVFVYDLRAHKGSATKGPFGSYSGNFFNDCVRDVVFLNKYLTKKYNLPITNISIGIGSVILTRAMQFYHEKCKNILVGTPFELFNIVNDFTAFITKMTCILVNKESEAKTINKIIYNNYAKKFEEGAYLSTNKQYIERIKNDKFCNFNLSANILCSIYKGKSITFSRKNLNKIDKEQKFLLASGEYDVVTNFTKETTQLFNRFKNCGIPCEKIIFKDLRHNLLNESSDTFIEYLEKFIGDEI